MAHRRGAQDRPGRAVPRRGVHPAGDDARARARSASTRATPTSPGAPTKDELEDYVERARRRRALHAAELLREHARTSCTSTCRPAGRPRSRSGPCSPRRCRRPGASTPATSCTSTCRCGRAARSTSTRRSTSCARATSPARDGRRPLAGAAASRALNRDPARPPGAAAAAQPALPPRRQPRHHRRSASATRPPATPCSSSCTLNPHEWREATVTSTCRSARAATGTTGFARARPAQRRRVPVGRAQLRPARPVRRAAPTSSRVSPSMTPPPIRPSARP